MGQLEDVLLHRRTVESNIEKSFSDGFSMNDELEKARHGVYADNAQNRKLNRVGQEYGKAAQPKEKAAQRSKKQEDDSGSYQKMASQASDGALKRAVADKDADPKVRDMAKKELYKRGKNNSSKESEGKKEESKSSVNSSSSKNTDSDKKTETRDSNSSLSNNTAKSVESAFTDLANAYEDAYDDDMNFNDDVALEADDKFLDKISDLVISDGLNERDFEKIKNSNPSWKYNFDIYWGDVNDRVAEKKELERDKRDVIREVIDEGGNRHLDKFMDDNIKYYQDVLKPYGARDLFDLQQKLEKENADNDKDPFGYLKYDKIYQQCLYKIPAKEFKNYEK